MTVKFRRVEANARITCKRCGNTQATRAVERSIDGGTWHGLAAYCDECIELAEKWHKDNPQSRQSADQDKSTAKPKRSRRQAFSKTDEPVEPRAEGPAAPSDT